MDQPMYAGRKLLRMFSLLSLVVFVLSILLVNSVQHKREVVQKERGGSSVVATRK